MVFVPFQFRDDIVVRRLFQRDCGVRVLVANHKLLPKILPLLSGQSFSKDGTSIRILLLWAGSKNEEIALTKTEIFLLPGAIAQQPSTNPGARMIDLDTASIVYTSGSTGKPRGAMLSHLNIVSNTRSIVDYLELTYDDRIMVVLPFHYIYGKSLLNTHFSP